MTTDKKISYEMQGKVRNYLGKQKMVKAPLHWQSGPGHPKTQLAYITKPELDLILKKDFHGSLKKGPNVGPSGIMSLNDAGTGRSGTEMSAAETGGTGHGMSAGEAAGHRQAAIAAGAQRTARDDIADYNRSQWNERFTSFKDRKSRDPRSSWGGGIGGLLRGALGIFGGIPGKVFSALSTAKNWAKNKAIGIGEEVDEFSNYDNFADYLNRNKNPTLGNDLGLAVNRQNAPIGPGLRVGEDPNRFQNTNITGGTDVNDFQGVNFNDQIEGTDNIANLIQNSKNNLSPSFQDGGRAGYRGGEFVDGDINVEGPNFDFNENIEMAEGKMPFDLRIEELMEKHNMSYDDAYDIAEMEFQDLFAQGESDQGIASLV